MPKIICGKIESRKSMEETDSTCGSGEDQCIAQQIYAAITCKKTGEQTSRWKIRYCTSVPVKVIVVRVNTKQRTHLAH